MTEVLDPSDCPVRSSGQWALSPTDLQGHLIMPDGGRYHTLLEARCGHMVPAAARRFTTFSRRKCPECHGHELAETILSLRVDDAGAAVSDLVTREAS